ncbi:MAG: 5-(carboxyamino)imidazole ribonucleotide mutase [Gemmataceae bacterium]
MQSAAEILENLGVPFETKVVSAHRTPDLLMEYAASAEGRGMKVIIAGAGGAAHLPGMAASKTVLPVLGVPVESKMLRGLDSLLSIVQMPAGIPVGTLAIGQAGAKNAGLLAAAILANENAVLRRNSMTSAKHRRTKCLPSKSPPPRLSDEPLADSSWPNRRHRRRGTIGAYVRPCCSPHGIPRPRL